MAERFCVRRAVVVGLMVFAVPVSLSALVGKIYLGAHGFDLGFFVLLAVVYPMLTVSAIALSAIVMDRISKDGVEPADLERSADAAPETGSVILVEDRRWREGARRGR